MRAGIFKMLFAYQFPFTGAVGLSFAIWATILLSQNGLQNGTSETLFAYMITDCILHYLRVVESVLDLQHMMEGKNPKVVGITGCLGIGLLIWNIVLLFRDIGIDHISDNPYYIYVFVSFLINMIALGLACILLLISVCCFGCIICGVSDDSGATAATATATAAATAATCPDSLSDPSPV